MKGEREGGREGEKERGGQIRKVVKLREILLI